MKHYEDLSVNWQLLRKFIGLKLDFLCACSFSFSGVQYTSTSCAHYSVKGRFHRLGLTPQLANPRLRDNQGLSPACIPSSSVNLTAHLTRDLTSFR